MLINVLSKIQTFGKPSTGSLHIIFNFTNNWEWKNVQIPFRAYLKHLTTPINIMDIRSELISFHEVCGPAVTSKKDQTLSQGKKTKMSDPRFTKYIRSLDSLDALTETQPWQFATRGSYNPNNSYFCIISNRYRNGHTGKVPLATQACIKTEQDYDGAIKQGSPSVTEVGARG
jgi:hypothetical protein